MSVLVIGSILMDVYMDTPVFPQPGTCIKGNEFAFFLGGKGVNQASSARRFGSYVYLSGSMGRDLFQEVFTSHFEREGINLSLIKKSTHSTGVFCTNQIQDGSRQNIVFPGANEDFKIDDLGKLEPILNQVNVVLTQFELSTDLAFEICKMARKHGKKIILNPAPSRVFDLSLLHGIDYLTPNQNELEKMFPDHSFESIEDYQKAGLLLLDKGVQNVIITLGNQGVLLVRKDLVKHYPGYLVDEVDSMGAGDTFNGVLAASLDQGKSLDEAIIYGNVAAMLSVKKRGSITGIPFKDEVISFLNNQ